MSVDHPTVGASSTYHCVPRPGCRPSPQSAEVLRLHALGLRRECLYLEELGAQLDDLEAHLRESLKEAMGRGSSLEGAYQGAGAASGRVERLASQVAMMRSRQAQRDTLQARRDLEEVSRLRSEAARAQREAAAQARYLDGLVGDDEVPVSPRVKRTG